MVDHIGIPDIIDRLEEGEPLWVCMDAKTSTQEQPKAAL